MTPDDILAAIPYASEDVIPVLITEYDRLKLRESILGCTACPLHESTTPVPWSGNRSAITIVGEAPGAQEEKMGEPFVGAAGNLLNSILRSAGLVRHELAFANTICCRPPKNDYSVAVSSGSVDACDANFIAQLDFTTSWLLVPMGANALSKFKGQPSPSPYTDQDELLDGGPMPVPKSPGSHLGITRERGKAFWWNARLVLPTFHPAYALRNSDATQPIIDDLKLARRYLSGAEEPPLCSQIDPIIVRGMRGPNDDAIKRHYTRHGWVIMFSPFLNARVAITNNPSSVPDGWGHAYTFTPYWVARMRDATPSMWSAAAALFRHLGAVPV